MTTTKPNLTAPIFLLGCHKSGSSLLRSLLDNHPQLFAIPMEIHYFQYTGQWVDYRLRRSWPKPMNQQEKMASLYQLVEETNANEDPYADSILAGSLDVDRFRSFMVANQGDSPDNLTTPRELFEIYVGALYYALTGAALPPGMRIVEKSVEHAEWAVHLRQMFPDCRFVHIVRNPYASMVAIRKSKTVGNIYPLLRNFILSLQNSYYNLYRNEGILDNYLIVKYEDLLTDTEKIMRTISDFVGIEFTEDLLTPTLMGKPWGGNSSTGKSFTKISTAPLSSWKSQVEDLEVRLVNTFLEPVLERFGYEMVTPQKSKYYLIKGESWKNYAKNRSLFWLY
ncbi:sulfotransferase [[Phormidium] sp. ETS-05]|uniref:sulfotransferase family protein n=1 Tax=[Phormidium] sp. ETS-05 TaxID=222819 RepID=UPI0018EED531|nr:sulfotransferase [[Phormidium] sp. ETS-05]